MQHMTSSAMSARHVSVRLGFMTERMALRGLSRGGRGTANNTYSKGVTSGPLLGNPMARFVSTSANTSPGPNSPAVPATANPVPLVSQYQDQDATREATKEQPEITVARMLHYCHRRQPRQALAVYSQLRSSPASASLLTPADLLVLINAIRQRQASKSDVDALVAIVEHLEQLAPGSTPVPVLEIVIVRAAQCKLPDIVFSQFTKLEQAHPSSIRLPVVAALLNTHRKLGHVDKVHTLAAKYQPLVAPSAPWVFHRIRLDTEAARTDDPAQGLENARALFAEYVQHKPQPAALAKAYARMAMIELDKGHVHEAKQVMAQFGARKLDATGSTCHVAVRLALLASPPDVDTALASWRQEVLLARNPGFAMSTELVLQAMLDAGRADVDVMGILAEYSQACRRHVGFARVKYSPYALVVRHWVAHTTALSKLSTISKIESVWLQIPGTPFLHDYAVEMMCRAWIGLGEAERAKAFVRECLQRGYVPKEYSGWTVKRVEAEAAERN